MTNLEKLRQLEMDIRNTKYEGREHALADRDKFTVRMDEIIADSNGDSEVDAISQCLAFEYWESVGGAAWDNLATHVNADLGGKILDYGVLE